MSKIQYIEGVFFSGDEAKEALHILETQLPEDAQYFLWDFCAFESGWQYGEPHGHSDNINRFAVDGETFALTWNHKLQYVGIHQYREV